MNRSAATEAVRTTAVAAGDLPFAAPLRAVDHVHAERREGGWALRATKAVVATDPYMPAHFPDFTIFPGVFILEALRQAVALALGESDGQFPEIVATRSVRFLAPLLPDDCLTLEATVGPVSGGKSFEVKAFAHRRDGVVAAQLKLEFRYGGCGDA